MKKILAVTLCLLLIFNISSLLVLAEEPEKTWSTSFDEATGTLTVSGTGVVSGLYPIETKYTAWDAIEYKKTEDNYSIKKLIIEEGIEQLSVSFSYLHELTEVVLPNSLKEIRCCFNYCEKLKSIEFPATLEWIRFYSFNHCDELSSIKFNGPICFGSLGSEDIELVGPDFCWLPSLEEITIPNGSRAYGGFYHCENLRKVVFEGYTRLEGIWEDFNIYPFDWKGSPNVTIYTDNERMEGQLLGYYEDRFVWVNPDIKIINTQRISTTATNKKEQSQTTDKKTTVTTKKTTKKAAVKTTVKKDAAKATSAKQTVKTTTTKKNAISTTKGEIKTSKQAVTTTVAENTKTEQSSANGAAITTAQTNATASPTVPADEESAATEQAVTDATESTPEDNFDSDDSDADVDAKPEDETGEVSKTEDATMQNGSDETTGVTEEKPKGKAAVIITVAAVVALAGGTAGVFVFKKRK